MKIFFANFLFFSIGIIANAQELMTRDPLKKHTWKAQWIAPVQKSLAEYGMYHYRKSFNLQQKPGQLIIHVSADNRYRLFVNGIAVCTGPAIGDLQHWYYETVDIAPYLQQGNNLIAAQVYNLGEYKPGRQISFKTSFILQADQPAFDVLNTNKEWKVISNESYRVIPANAETIPNYYKVLGFYTAGPGDEVNGNQYPWGWETQAYNDHDWPQAKIVRDDAVNVGVGRGYAYGSARFLEARPIQLLQETTERSLKIVRSTGLQVAADVFSQQKALTIPAFSKLSLLLDASRMSFGYPELIISKGKGSRIKITYAEALFDKDFKKGNRNEIKDKSIYGLYDVFLPDGGSQRVFRPLWMRAFRYIQLDIETGAQEMLISDFYNKFSAYPLLQKAKFESSDPLLEKIMATGWRTLQLCAQDNFFSDAYFEQMQYIGDARTQAMATYCMTGNDDLYRQAIRQVDYSRIAEGLTQSRYPARETQVIPSYSLVWIAMIHDYLMIRNDHEFVSNFVPGIQNVLYWFQQHVDSTGLLGKLDWWYFPDREPEDSGHFDDHSALASLQFADALSKSSEIFNELGLKEDAEKYKQMSQRINEGVYKYCYRDKEGLFAESPTSNLFTQGTNAMAIVSGAVPPGKEQLLMQKIVEDKKLKESTLYYRFYLSRAMEKSGYTKPYFTMLYPWLEMLNNGMTAFGEVAKNPRSDCHPWSASPNIDFFSMVCGVKSTSFGYKTVSIAPTFGDLSYIKAVLPHPDGAIKLDLKKDKNDHLKGTVELPPGVTGMFRWKGKDLLLKGGEQEIDLE